VVWLTIISVLILGEVVELFSGARQVVHSEEGLLLGVVLVPCHEDVVFCLFWNPGCKVTAKSWLRAGADTK
jgi:hypothetical protein